MNNDSNNKRNEDKYLDKNPNKNSNPVNNERDEINPANRSWESSENPDTDNDRKGRNVDIDQENQENEMRGREQQTTPKSSAQDIKDGFNRRENSDNK